MLQHFPFHDYRWHVVTIETVVPAMETLLARHGYRHALDITHRMPTGHRKLLDHLYIHHNISGGIDAARARARESIRLWDSAMAKRRFRGTSVSEETIYRVNCGGVPEAFVATAGNESALFPERITCSCSI